MIKSFSIKIFVPGGDPDGIRIIEKSNWSGSGISFPRALVKEAKTRRELDRTGVYVLTSPPEQSGLPRVYVGEGDPIRQRVEQHAAQKDFWTHCIGFTSKDGNLNKAHVQYLESRLVTLATQAKRCVLENSNAPALPSLSESDAAEVEAFLEEVLLCLPVLGVSVFNKAGAVAIKPNKTLYLSGKGIHAQGAETQDGFLVRAGSTASHTESPSCHVFLKEIRAALLANGALKPAADGYVFTQDYLFASPSSAAGVALGRPANGRIEWKLKDGTTLKEIQEAESKE